MSLGTNLFSSVIFFLMYDYIQSRNNEKENINYNIYIKNKMEMFLKSNGLKKEGFIGGILYGKQDEIHTIINNEKSYYQILEDIILDLKNENNSKLHEILNLFYSVKRIKDKLEQFIEKFEKFNNLDEKNVGIIEKIENCRLRKSKFRYLDSNLHVLKVEFENLNNQNIHYNSNSSDFTYDNFTEIIKEYNDIIDDYFKG